MQGPGYSAAKRINALLGAIDKMKVVFPFLPVLAQWDSRLCVWGTPAGTAGDLPGEQKSITDQECRETSARDFSNNAYRRPHPDNF